MRAATPGSSVETARKRTKTNLNSKQIQTNQNTDTQTTCKREGEQQGEGGRREKSSSQCSAYSMRSTVQAHSREALHFRAASCKRIGRSTAQAYFIEAFCKHSLEKLCASILSSRASSEGRSCTLQYIFSKKYFPGECKTFCEAHSAPQQICLYEKHQNCQIGRLVTS